MTGFRIVVADDEPLARSMVSGLLREDPEIETIVECGDATEVRHAIERVRADIVFLDVEMPEVDGIAIASDLSAEKPVVVFVTAYSQYATQAFDVRAADYVLKPFTDRRFREAVRRAKERVLERRSRDTRNATTAVPPSPERSRGAFEERLQLKEGERTLDIQTADIVWIEAQDYYARVHTNQGRHLVRVPLSTLESRLDPGRFVRVHRAALINLDAVRETRARTGLQLTMSDGATIEVSRARRRAIAAALELRSGGRL
jgi:two-component system, LytTR family, response regulator